ncbi:hypothetical protein MRX96_054746 [Rhipicephalus microplus]
MRDARVRVRPSIQPNLAAEASTSREMDRTRSRREGQSERDEEGHGAALAFCITHVAARKVLAVRNRRSASSDCSVSANVERLVRAKKSHALTTIYERQRRVDPPNLVMLGEAAALVVAASRGLPVVDG